MIGSLLVVLTGILLVAGTWVGGYFLVWPLWLKIVLTSVVVLLVVSWFVGRRVLAVMRARALERDILKQAEDQALNARPDRRAEIMQLQVQMRRGMEALKTSKLGATSAGALYSLPWYIVLGPPGAGKSTALRHSGLVFPYLDPEGGGVRGVGGTRNCDWWFTNEGILLDTAGRYSTGTSDSDEWLAFLGFLKKYRPRKPVNGIVVAISVADLVDANEEQIEAHASNLRARIDEVMTRLKMILPVYVMFTKADLVDGFSIFWQNLRKSDRSQILGMTFPLAAAGKPVDASKQFEDEFDLLVENVHARALRRMGEERDVVAREKIFQYPLEFYALKANIADLLGGVFRQNPFQETPILRGVYFSSGTQEGRPFAKVIRSMLRAFNLAPSETAAASPQDVENKSYFVTDVFRRIIFPDQDVAAWTTTERRRQLVQRLFVAALTVLAAAIVLLPASCSFIRNRELVQSTEKVATEATSVDWKDNGPLVEKIHALDGAREHLKELDTWRTDGAPIGYRWGMYAGDDLYPSFRGAYISSVHAGFAVPTQVRLEEELRSADAVGALTTEQYNTYFNRLKAYLEACDIEKLEVPWETLALTDGWGRSLALSSSSRLDKDILKPHVNYYLELMKRKEIPPWICDLGLIGRVRAKLKRVSAEDRDFSALLRDANEYAPPITRESIFLNTAFGTYIASKSNPEVFVAGAFTKLGWESFVRDRLGKDRIEQLAIDRWVLGETQPVSIAQTEKQISEIRERYFISYQRAWADFLKDLDVRSPTSNDEALDELNALSEVPWPYQRLMKVLGENVRLEESTLEKVGDALLNQVERNVQRDLQRNNPNTMGILNDAGVLPNQPIAKRWVSPPEAAFEPMVKFGLPDTPAGNNPQGTTGQQGTGLTHYQNRIIAKLVAVLTDLRDSKGRGVEPKTVSSAFEEAIRSTNELMTPTQSGFTRPLLSPLLLNPIELSWKGVLGDLRGATGGTWESDVWRQWHAQLDDGYPFSDTWRDVKLSDYTEFFKPDGLLFKFYEGNLTTTLEKNGNKFVPATRFKHAINYSSTFIKCYERGLEISQATFPPKSVEPMVEFETNLHSVSDDIAEVTFQIDGTSRTYKNTPEEWVRVQWPAKGGDGAAAKVLQSRIRIKGYNGLEEEILRPGEWGMFRLFDAAKSITAGTEGGRPSGRPTTVVTWAMRTQGGSFVKMDVRPLREDNPFTAYLTRKERVFRGYNCPRVMSLGVR